MAKQLLAAGALAIAVTSLVTGSGQQLPGPSAVKVQWRTPWGDPDLQGNYTNKYEQSTPFERPPEFEGRLLADVAGAELAGILKRREQQAIDRAPGVGPLQFRDSLEVTKGSRAWLVVDPPDGKIPPLTAQARRRFAQSATGVNAVTGTPVAGSS